MHLMHRLYQFACDKPDHPAVVINSQAVSYLAFYKLIQAARRYIAGQDPRPGSIAIASVPGHMDGWIVILALRSLGLTTVVVRSPQDVEALSGLDVSCLVTTYRSRRPDAEQIGALQHIRLPRNALDDALAAPLEPPVVVEPSGGHILLTSGTTGLPKKVLIDDAYEVQSAETGRERYKAIGDALVQDDTNVVVNIVNFGLWTAAGYQTPPSVWANGDTLILHEGEDIARSFAYPGITFTVLTPDFLNRVLNAPEGTYPRQPGMQLMVGGGALSLALAAKARERLTDHVCTALGSTEAGGLSITPVETDEDLIWHRLYPDRVVEVVDEDHQPLPAGQMGQVRVLIESSITGYYADEETSKAYFRDGYFYPGDLGVIDDRRRLRLMGRVTDIIHIMGSKYPAEPFEQAFRDALGLEGVCVFTEQGSSAEEEIHVALETPRQIAGDVLAPIAKQVLPRFPHVRFHFVGEMPRNHMGKIRRFALKQLLAERETAGRPLTAQIA